MNPRACLLLARPAALLLALSAVSGLAQTAPSDSKAPATSSDEVVTLSEFSVTATEANGYVASESVTGTRIASAIKDLPFNVNVVTGDFMRDFALFDFNDQLSFVSGFSPSDALGVYQLRGFQSSSTLVDGFRRIGLADVVDIERIEVIKGPAADIYGAILPGGVPNIITKQPTQTPTQGIDVSGGTEEFLHADAYSSGPLGNSGKLFYRVDVANLYESYGFQDFSNQHQDYVSFQLLWKPDANTSIRMNLEDNEDYIHPRSQVPYIDIVEPTLPFTNAAHTQYTGLAVPSKGIEGLPANFDPGGPNQYDHNRLHTATFTLEHRFSDLWSIRASANGFENPDDQFLLSTANFYPFGTSTLTATTPYNPLIKEAPLDLIDPQHGGGYQVDSLFKFKVAGVTNQILLTNDYYQVSKRFFELEAAEPYYNPFNPNVIAPGQTALGWGFTPPAVNPALYTTIENNYWNTSEDYGLFASDHLSFWNDRIIFLAGVRYDFVWNEVRNYHFQNPANSLYQRQDTSYGVHAWTHQYGLLAKVTDNISLYGNVSSAFNPNPQLDQYANPLPNNSSTGDEFGIKTSWFGGRLNVTVDHFEVNEFDLAHSTRNSLDLPVVVLTGQETAKGEEVDFNWQATSSLQFIGGYGYTDAKIVNSYGLPFLDGTPPPQVPRNNLGVAARYTVLTGPARGLFFLLNERYFSKSIVSVGSGNTLTATATSPVFNVPYAPYGFLPNPSVPEGTALTSGTYVVTDGRENIWNAPYALFGAGVGYEFKTGKFTHRITINGSNLLNRYYTFGTAAPGAGTAVIGTYSLKF